MAGSITQKLVIETQVNAESLEKLGSVGARSFQQIAAAAKQTQAGTDAFAKRLTELGQGSGLVAKQARELQTLVETEGRLQKALQQGNLTIEERRKVEGDLVRATEAVTKATASLGGSFAIAFKQSQAGVEAIAARITTLSQGAQLEGTRAESIQKLIGVEAGLHKALQNGNLTFQERIKLEQQAARATTAIANATAGLGQTTQRSARESGAGIDAIATRIQKLSQAAQLAGTRAEAVQRLIAVEDGLQKALKRGNLSFEERARVERQAMLADAAIRDSISGLGPSLAKGATAIQQFSVASALAFDQVGGAAGQAFSRVQALLSSKVGVAGISGVVFAAIGAAAVKMAADIESSLTRVAAAVPEGTRGLSDLREEIRALSKETGESQTDIAELALEAARTGAESAESAGERVRAALTAAKASGEETRGIIGSLDTVLDLFNKSSADSAETLAEFLAAARGHGSLTELLDILKAGAPALRTLNLDASTTARALTALGERTGTVRQAGSEFIRLADQGEAGKAAILALAASVPVATDALGDMERRAASVSDTLEGKSKKSVATFADLLLQLGGELKKFADATVAEILTIANALDRLQHFLGGAVPESFLTAAFADIKEFAPEIEAARSRVDVFATSFRQVEEAAADVAKAVREGTVDLKTMSGFDLHELTKNVQAIASSDFLKPEAKRNLEFLLKAIEQVQLAKIPEAPSTPTAGSTDSGVKVPTAEEIDRLKRLRETQQRAREEQKRTAEEVQRSTRDMGQAFDDLFARAEAGDITVADFDRSIRELADKFADLQDKLTKAKLPTTDLVNEFGRLASEATAVRANLSQLKAAQAAAEFEQLKASLTSDTLDDFRLALVALHEELKKKGFTDDQIREIEDLKKTIDDAARAFEGTQKNSAAVIESQIPALEKISRLEADRIRIQIEEREIAEELRNGTITQEQAEHRRKSIADRILAVDQAIDQVAQQNAAHLEAAATAGNTLADTLGNAAKAAFGIATAILGADSAITKAIGSTIQLIDGLASVAKLAKDAGSVGKLFSSSAGIASALPGIGQIIGAIGGIASVAGLFGKSPAQQAQIEALRENTRRMEELRAKIGDLINVTASGRTISSVTRALDATGPVPRVSAFEPASFLKFIGDFQKQLAASGLTFKDVKDLAKELGITFNGSAESFRQLSKVLHDLDFKAFADTFAGQLRALNDEFELFPERFDTNAKKFAATVELLNNTKLGAPDLFKGFQGLDISTDEGIEAARKAIQELFDRAREGKLTAEELNGLSLDEFLEMLKRLNSQLPQIKSAAERFNEAMDLLGIVFEFSGADAATRLAKITEKFKELFPDLAASIDFSSADAFKESLEKIIEGFAADGELTDAEKAQIAILRALRDAFTAAQPAAEQFIAVLDALADQFDIFGTGAEERFKLLGDALGESFPDIKDLLAGIDPTTAEGRAELQKRAEALFTKLAEGGITEDEKKIIDAIKRILGASRDIATEQLAAAEKAAADARAKRKEIRDRAEREIDVKDIDDPLERLKIRLRAALESVPGLVDALGDFDLSTEEGRKALDDFIADIVTHPEKLEALAKDLGIPLEELIEIFLGLETGSDAVTDALKKMATAAQEFADKVNAALDELNFQLDLRGITDPIQRLIETARVLASLDPAIAKALAGLDLATDAGRKAAEAALVALGATVTDPTLRKLILQLVQAIRGASAPAAGQPGETAPGASGGEGATTFQGTPQITVQQADRLTDIGRSQLVTLQNIYKAITSFLATVTGTSRTGQSPAAAPAPSPPSAQRSTTPAPLNVAAAVAMLRQALPALPPVRPPALPSSQVTVHAGDIHIHAPATFHVGGGSPAEVRRQVVDAAEEWTKNLRKQIGEVDKLLGDLARKKALNAGKTARS